MQVLSSPAAALGVSDPLAFTPSLGRLAFSWLSQGTVLVARVVDGVAPGGGPIRPFDVDVGKVNASLVGVVAASSTGPPVPSTPLPVGGTWGVPGPPTVSAAVATNAPGGPAGVGPGDGVAVVFDQELAWARVPVATDAQLRALLAFVPPLPPTVPVTGAWLDDFTLAVTFGGGGDAGAEAAALAAWGVRPGALVVTVLAAGDLRSANLQSEPSSARAPVTGGTFGDAAGANVTSLSSTALRVMLFTPGPVPPPYPVTAWLLQWDTSPAFAGVGAVAGWGDAAVRDGANVTGLVPALVVGAPGLLVAVTAVGVVPGVSGTLVLSTSEPLPVGASLQVDLTGLTPLLYHVRAAFNAPVFRGPDTVGPWGSATPPAVRPLPPVVTAVQLPGSTLLCAGGEALVLIGSGACGVHVAFVVCVGGGG